MSDIISVMANLNGMVHLEGASDAAISDAEQKLNLSFADDYKAYINKYGVVSANGTELTGIVSSARLNVIDVTLEERENSKIPLDMYVVEDTHIEGLLILQNTAGEVYKFYSKNQMKKIFDSLTDYLLSK